MHLIVFQYNKELGSFWEDYRKIDFAQFYSNLYLLGGHIGEKMRGRRYLIGETSEDSKEFKVWAAKSCMTPEIGLYRKRMRKGTGLNQVNARLGALDDVAMQNRERRLKEKKKAPFKSWR